MLPGLGERFDDPGPGGQAVGVHEDLVFGGIDCIHREDHGVLFVEKQVATTPPPRGMQPYATS